MTNYNRIKNLIKINITSILLILISSCSNSTENVSVNRIPEVFKFSEDIKLSAEEKKVDSLFSYLRENLLINRGNSWSYFYDFASNYKNTHSEKLYELFKQLPKGGLQHVHASATCDINYLIDIALSMPDCYVFWQENNDNYKKGQLGVFPDNQIPDGWVKIHELNNNRANLKNELYKLYTIGSEDYGLNLWTEFENIFQRVDAFISYKPVFIDYYKHSFELFAEENIGFIELRTSVDRVMTESGTYIYDTEVLEMYKSILSQVKAKYPDFSFGIIICGWRGDDTVSMNKVVTRANNLHSQYPDLILGFDLVGEEDSNQKTQYFSEYLNNCTFPLYLHAGESLNHSNNNIAAALQLNAKRIAHALNLIYFPNFQNEIINKDIAVELCPISNQALGYIRDFRTHPGINYLRSGIQCTINSDDPAIFQSNGLTDDFFAAYISWYLDLASIKKLALNSITYSGFNSSEIQNLKGKFDTNWNNYIKNIVNSYNLK